MHEGYDLGGPARRSLHDHQQPATLLDATAAAQRTFRNRYGDALADLADDLAATLAELAQRQQRGAALTRDAAARFPAR